MTATTGGGVSRAEGVVFAFAWGGESRDAPQLAVGVEHVAPPGQYLVPVGLVPHVPDDAVVGRVEHIVQGHGEFHHAEARPQVSRVLGHLVDDERAQFGGDHSQVFLRHLLQVGRGVYLV